MSGLNWVDYVFIVILAFSVLSGFSRGFVKEIISLITLCAAIVLATIFATTLAATFVNSHSVQGLATQASTAIGADASQPVSYAAIGLSFGLIFLGTVIFGAGLGFFINLAFSVGVLGFGNRVLGAFFGVARGVLLNLTIIFVVQLTSFAQQDWWQQSQVVQRSLPVVTKFAAYVSPGVEEFMQKAYDLIQKNAVAPKADASS
jgi:membrane protein required for colicin V production